MFYLWSKYCSHILKQRYAIVADLFCYFDNARKKPSIVKYAIFSIMHDITGQRL